MKGKERNDNILILYSNEFLHKGEQNIVICKLREIFFFTRFSMRTNGGPEVCLPATDNNCLIFSPSKPLSIFKMRLKAWKYQVVMSMRKILTGEVMIS